MDHLHVASQRSRLAIAVSTVVALIAALILVISPSRSLAAEPGDQIYWGNEQSAVRVGNLDGSLLASNVFGSQQTPCGVAIDPAAGKIYWTSWFGNGLRVGNLDGTGDGPGGEPLTLFPEGGHDLCGVAVDPAAGKIYWADFTADTIRVGNLDGSVSPDSPKTLFSEPTEPKSAPSGVAIDPAAGKIYWTNQFTDQVRVGNLDGTGTASTLFGGEDNPIGVAIDTAAEKLYWTDLGSGLVRSGNLDGSGASTLFSGESQPGGLAIDPEANTIYWATFGPGQIRVGNLDDPDSASTLFSGESASLFAAILKTPAAGTAPPAISEAGGALSCSEGEWASDLLGAFLYRAPQSFAYQWLKDGSELSGKTEPILTPTPTEPGAYTCQVTASNHAGSTSQTSDAFTVSAQATLHIDKFYDANANGQLDGSEGAIAGWRVNVGGTSYLTPQSLIGNPGDYVVTESNPVQTNWLHTTAGSVPVSLDAGEEATVEFGNVCLGGGGAQATGFWSNKNGQALFGSDDLTSMVALNLREANGSAFDPANYNAFKSWLQKATATNMANKLSAELATMKLNVINSKVNGGSLIYAPGTTSGIAGFATVNAVMAEANSELGLHGLTKSGSPFRSYQTALKDALERANSNLSFVQQSPCGFSFPPIP